MALPMLLVLASCNPAPKIPFAEDGLDFARIEHEMPLSRADRNEITRENLAALTQEQLDQVYARLTAGPIPNAAFEGDLFFPKGQSGDLRLSEIVGGGLRGVAVKLGVTKLDLLGEVLWKGKVFDRETRILRNRIQDLATLRKLGLIQETPPLDKVEINGGDQYLLFPAKLYCGQSLLDGRRESIIIDYAFTDDLPGYRTLPDRLAGREGFQVRDEIRMVRPGLYLGRAYLGRFFALNFVLYNEELAEQGQAAFDRGEAIAEDCWVGTQSAATASVASTAAQGS